MTRAFVDAALLAGALLLAGSAQAQVASAAQGASAVPAASAIATAAAAPNGDDCRVPGVRTLVQCGFIERPLDPDRPDGPKLTIRYAVVPAMARNKLPDPVFLFAGGPGQSAVSLIPVAMSLFQRLNNRRDIVFVDQRGTGGSAPLECADPEDASLADQSEPGRQARFVANCRKNLIALPYIGNADALGRFPTWIAVRDFDAVRARLGYAQINVIGGSYGTRSGLEYLRQFPDRVRRLVIDGVAPPDMVLPESAEPDNDAAWQALMTACAGDPACNAAHPRLGERFEAFLATLPRAFTARQPLTGRPETFTLTREMVLGAVRSALYAPAFASALPEALERAMAGDLDAMLGLGASLLSRKSSRIALGMHLSVVCAEDLPLARGSAAASAASGTTARSPAASGSVGPFRDAFANQYQRLCADWPRGPVPAAFYTIPPSPAPVLVLSGGLDPVTPPRHGARVAQALGPNARHVVVANAGHGTMSLACMRDVIARFVGAETPAAAQAVDASCASRVPRPAAFVSIGAAQAAASTASGAASGATR